MSNEKVYKLLKLLVLLLGRLPISVATFCSDLLGLLWFKLDKRHRKVTLDNIEKALGDQMTPFQVMKTGKQVFKNIASIFFEIAWSYGLDRETLLSHFTVKGIEHLESAQAKGRGVMVLAGHLGNFDLNIHAIEETRLKGYGLYRKMDFEPLERLLLDIRQRFGLTMVPIRGASKKLDTILGEGGVVGTLLDQSVDWYRGVFVDFFGRSACTNNGFAALVMRTKTAVVPMCGMRKNRKFVIEFFPEIPLEQTGDRIKDIENNTQNYTTVIESMVRRFPDQYFWVHNRWKIKPYCSFPRK
ncbi:MAG: lysophospholipid acyltransferase family protein [Desulfobacteraceae bacterium]|nr:lysophospholipid acyltransferase family protein [Desulfobacteraceae bacterium]